MPRLPSGVWQPRACWPASVCPSSDHSPRLSRRPTRGCRAPGRSTRCATTPRTCCTPSGLCGTRCARCCRDLTHQPSFCPVSTLRKRGRMLLANLSPAALQDSLAVRGDVVAGGPECPRRSRSQPQTLAGVRIVDAVVGRQQCPYRVLVVADDAVGHLACGGKELIVWNPFGHQAG